MRARTLIGLTGYATVGKDVVADALVAECGFVKLGWADRLLQVAAAINPEISLGLDTVSQRLLRFLGKPRKVRFKKLLEQAGYIEAKKNPEFRGFLQWLGTEVGREMIHPDIWVLATMRDVHHHLSNGRNVVITNCRFNNEAETIRKAGGRVYEVCRPGVGPANGHQSEAGISDRLLSGSFFNSGTRDELQQKAVGLYDRIKDYTAIKWEVLEKYA